MGRFSAIYNRTTAEIMMDASLVSADETRRIALGLEAAFPNPRSNYVKSRIVAYREVAQQCLANATGFASI